MDDTGIRRLGELVGEDFTVSGLVVDKEGIGFAGVDVAMPGERGTLSDRIAVLNAINNAIRTAQTSSSGRRYTNAMRVADTQVARLEPAAQNLQPATGSGIVLVDPGDAAEVFKA